MLLLRISSKLISYSRKDVNILVHVSVYDNKRNITKLTHKRISIVLMYFAYKVNPIIIKYSGI